MASRPYRHRVERTRNKHSRAVFRDNTIVIRLAKNLSRTERREHIEDLLRRMTQQLLEEEQTKITVQPFRALLEGAQQCTVRLATGKTYTFVLEAGPKLAARRTTRGWVVTVSLQTRRAGLHRFLWKLLSEEESGRIVELAHRINVQTLQVPVRKVHLRFASSQWGSCSPRGIIMLNTALLFTPPSVLKYVIVHELAHRRRADHSPAYWRVVESAMPNYAEVRARLHEYQLPALS